VHSAVEGLGEGSGGVAVGAVALPLSVPISRATGSCLLTVQTTSALLETSLPAFLPLASCLSVKQGESLLAFHTLFLELFQVLAHLPQKVLECLSVED
jgi:hypothetical protein